MAAARLAVSTRNLVAGVGVENGWGMVSESLWCLCVQSQSSPFDVENSVHERIRRTPYTIIGVHFVVRRLEHPSDGLEQTGRTGRTDGHLFASVRASTHLCARPHVALDHYNSQCTQHDDDAHACGQLQHNL